MRLRLEEISSGGSSSIGKWRRVEQSRHLFLLQENSVLAYELRGRGLEAAIHPRLRASGEMRNAA